MQTATVEPMAFAAKCPAAMIFSALLLAATRLAARADAADIAADVEVYGTLVPHVELMDSTGATPLSERAGATQVLDAAFTGINEPGRSLESHRLGSSPTRGVSLVWRKP